MFLKPRYLAIEKAEHATEPPTSIASLFFPSEFRLSYIYLELLCETGLLGFCVFIMAMASSIVITWKNINYLSHQERDVELTSIKLALSVSFAIQFFVLLYGMTGNPIYDSTFCFYAVAVAINISFTSNMRGRI